MNSAPGGNAGGPADDRDYLDKGLDAVEKKFGGKRFAGSDAVQKNRAMNEKITDFIRKMIEKVTGYGHSCCPLNFSMRHLRWTLEANVLVIYRKRVPAKFSN